MTKKIPSLPIAKRPVSPVRQKAFLEALERTGVVAEAARLASPHSANVKGASGSFYALRRRSAHFSAAWDEAQEKADAALLVEARRRAIHGSQRGIFQKGVQAIDAAGNPATETIYSDRLLELLLKSRFPNDFVERRQVEHRTTPEGWVITGQDLFALTEAETEQLAAIMAKVMEHRGEIEHDPGMADAAMIDITPTENDGNTPVILGSLEARE